jgi:hypothetical protein
LFDQRAFRRPDLVKLAEYMAHDHSAPADMFQALGGEAVEPVIIAFDSEDRCNPFELFDNLKLAYVARVDNQVDGSEKPRQRGIKQPVRIRYQAQSHNSLLLDTTNSILTVD